MMLSGNPPFYGESEMEILQEIYSFLNHGQLDFDEPVWKKVSDEAKDLIKSMLCDYSYRLTAEEVLFHPWLEIFVENKDVCLNFARANDLKKIVLTFIASQINDNDLKITRANFLNLDKKNKGYLTFDDFKQGLPQEKREYNKLNRLFEMIDLNKNGNIDYIEFVTATLDIEERITIDLLKRAFQFFNPKDEKFSLTEIKAVFKKYGTDHCPNEYWEDLFAKIDINQKGFINFEDFCEIIFSENSNSNNNI